MPPRLVSTMACCSLPLGARASTIPEGVLRQTERMLGTAAITRAHHNDAGEPEQHHSPSRRLRYGSDLNNHLLGGAGVGRNKSVHTSVAPGSHHFSEDGVVIGKFLSVVHPGSGHVWAAAASIRQIASCAAALCRSIG